MKKKIHISFQTCDFCGTCVAVCPEDAIELKQSFIKILDEKCTGCGNCVAVCPLGVLKEGDHESTV